MMNNTGTTENRLLRALLCLCASVLTAAAILGILPLDGEEGLYENVVRLHVLANSDSAEDQALKLRVRDAVLLLLADSAKDAESAEDAAALYEARLPEIERTALDTVRDAGYDYSVKVTLSGETYPDRTYGDYTFPAGTYRSLRVQLGAAEGHNWWCVLFPPLCLSLASGNTKTAAAEEKTSSGDGRISVSPDGDELLMSAGFTPYEVGLLTGGKQNGRRVRVKFMIVEWIRTLFHGENR